MVMRLDDRERARGPIIRALAAIGPDYSQIVAELVAIVEGVCPKVSSPHIYNERTEIHAAIALGRLGTRAEPALPALRLALHSNDDEFRAAARKAIVDIERALDEK